MKPLTKQIKKNENNVFKEAKKVNLLTRTPATNTAQCCAKKSSIVSGCHD